MITYTVTVKYEGEEKKTVQLKSQKVMAAMSMFNSIFNMLFDDEFYFIENIVLSNQSGEGLDRKKRKFFSFDIKKS